jgi:carbon-monoxide dehydrogenase iron sulfur subunit
LKIVKTNPDLCTGCGTCEEVCSKTLFKEINRDKSAIVVTQKDGHSFDINVCNQCGECIDICPVEAIYRAKNGTVMIDKSKCVQCYACVGFCPTLSMRYHKDVTGPFKCIACGACTRQCPTGAIRMEEA